jgi:molecular chaperone HscB
MQYYEALGLEPKLALDLEDLKKRFYERSRQWHPDRFSRSGAEEQQRALDMTAVLNDAFRTLRDPVSRAEYFLREWHVPLLKDAPLDFLDEVFEMNMALEELRSGNASARADLEACRERFAGKLAKLDADLATWCAKHDAHPDGDLLEQIRVDLGKRRYIANLVRDVDKELNVHISN